MATRTRTTKQQDNRKPNFQPNSFPAHLTLVISMAGERLGSIKVPQRDKLSANGNVTFGAKIADGWVLPGTWDNTLPALGFSLELPDGTIVELSKAASGVHTSDSGNPTVGHTCRLSVTPDEKDASAMTYMGQVYPTWLVKKGSYGLYISVNPAGGGTPGPQVVGDVDGLVIDER